MLPFVACALLFGIGFICGRVLRPTPPPLLIERNQLSSSALSPKAGATDKASGATNDSSAHAYGADGTAVERPTDPAEIVSICGARTKRGTPCSRRVRGTGRCWQHRGKPAMLPAAKLLVQE